MTNMRNRRSPLTVAVAAIAALALTGCSSGTGAVQEVELTTASYESTKQLAAASEYLVRVQFTSEPVAQQLRDAEYLTYWVSQATVEEVVGQRPDVTKSLKVGQTIPIATQLLSADSTTKVSIDGGEFPAKSELPAKGERAVTFLVYDPELGGYGPGYQAVGRAAVGADNTATMRGIHGGLNADKTSSRAVTTDLRSQYQGKAPWRTNPPQPGKAPAPGSEPAERLPEDRKSVV